MGEASLPQELLERVLEFVDGETLLTCAEVSPEFAAAVKYLTTTKDIWKRVFKREKAQCCSGLDVIAKLYPHEEGFDHEISWGLVYQSSLLGKVLARNNPTSMKECRICKEHATISDIEVHDNLIILLVKYKKDFAVYFKLVTVNLNNKLIDKSGRFFANVLYVSPLEKQYYIRQDSIRLPCNKCRLMAVPITSDLGGSQYPKFMKNDNFLTVRHSHTETLWINTFGKLISRGKSFLTGSLLDIEKARAEDSKALKVFLGFASLTISCGGTIKEFNTFRYLQATVTSSFTYADVLLLGTDTGTLFAYVLKSESDLDCLDLQSFIWKQDVCQGPILAINIMELKDELVIVSATERDLYQVRMDRELKCSAVAV